MRPSARLSIFICLLVSAPLAVRTAQGDDFKLKDGSTISGTIVGFDADSFKVQMSYGFAIVRKDQVVSIRISDSKSGSATSDAAKNSGAVAASAAPATSTPAPPPETKPAISPDVNAYAKPVAKAIDRPAKKPVAAPVFAPPAPPSAIAAASMPPASAPPGMQSTAVLVPAASSSASSASASPAAPANPSSSAANPKSPEPEPIREEVDGNSYLNQTYGFRMYKPPAWHVLAAARTVLPGAIAALGTDDESTYLLIGQEPAGKSLALAAEQTQKRLADILENYRAIGQQQIQVSNDWVVERRFRGGVDGQDWSGVVVLIPHGEHLFTIFGMTRADNDLVQIQENVIARAISSIEFTSGAR